MTGCALCPRRCGADRTERAGFCKSGNEMHIARAKLHFWEEPPISGTRGSGTIFFTGCNLRCAFCQNSVISSGEGHGRAFDTDGFIALMRRLEKNGAHNINLVTPTHFVDKIAEALRVYKPKIPVVYNTGGYESAETLRLLDGLADIYLPDFKYADDTLAARVSSAENYRETALSALSEMVRQTGENQYDADGLLLRGVLVRHLILPGHTRNSIAVLELLRARFPALPVSLMAQYTPAGRVLTDAAFSDLNRRITKREHEKVLDCMLSLGLDGFCQKRSAAGERYIPDFTQFDAVNGEREDGMQNEIQLYSPMEKLFPDGEGILAPPYTEASALLGEETAFQALLPAAGAYRVAVRTDAPVTAEIFRVGMVPCGMAAYPDRNDGDYLSLQGGLFPDVLCPVTDGVVETDAPAALWVKLRVHEDGAGGTYPVEISANGQSAVFYLTVVQAQLPEIDFTYTQWLHADCIASLHRVEIYSEAHWALLRRYMRAAVQHGVNMLLTPVFTPALDTAVGTERPSVQLAAIEKTDAGYRFDFALLKRWVDTARCCGIEKFEIAHLFSQWGAKCAPNIYVTENGVKTLRFGWHTAAEDPDYAALLAALLPALLAFFEGEGISRDRLMFHISDEPGEADRESYLAAKRIAAPYLTGCTVRDALSDFSFYESGAAEHPIVATDHIEPFLESGVSDLWAYVCCGQCVDVGNRFLAMPAHRNRVLGVQLWKHGIKGFLHWGFNFWYLQESKGVIDPFKVTDAGGAFPAGDAFSVYPGENGPWLSTRLKVFLLALQDYRALCLLEGKIGRERTLALLNEGQSMTFKDYPRTAQYYLDLRARVNAAIQNAL